MKQILLIIFSFFLGQTSFAQTDSVFLSIDSKLIPQIQIITPNGENGIRENYSHFKYHYWLDNIDTVSMTIISKIEPNKSKTKKMEYHKYGACDSIINKIRNNTQYWKTKSEIEQFARQEIGYGNDEFNNLQNSESNRLNDFSSKCQDEFTIEISELKNVLFKEVQRIKESKVDRFNQRRSNPESVDSLFLNSFLKTFDLCDADLKSLELVILQNPTDFITSIDKMSDSDFFSFTLNLDDFPENAKISEMKEELKEVATKSKRKKQIIKKIKITKS